MRLTLVTVLVFLSSVLRAQNWQAVGPDDFKQVSLPGAAAPYVFTDTLGNAYVAFIDSFNTTYRRFIIKKETANGWVTITQIQNVSQIYSLIADKAGNIYLAADTSIAGTPAIFVTRFDGVSWSPLGSPYPVTASPSSNLIMKIDLFGNPHILYCASGISVFPGMIKWDGASWIPLGQSITNTASGSMDFDFDSYNMPHVLYRDALNNNNQIKKYDGINWITVNTNVPAGSLKIHKDTMYVAIGDDAIHGGTYIKPPSTIVRKYNGTNWIYLASVTSPMTPANASTQMHFDSVGNLYVYGGTIWKIHGNTASNFGAAGNMAFMGQDTIYTTSALANYGRKVQIQKRVNNTWVDDQPISINPFRGGSVHTYFVYGPSPSHSFFSDKHGVLTLHATVWGASQAAFARHHNGAWDTSLVSVPPNISSSSTIIVDSSNTPYLLTSSFPYSSNLNLYRFSGTSWMQVGVSISSSYSYGSVVFDTTNVPYVAFVDETNFGAKRIRVKKHDGTNWTEPSATMPFVSSGISTNPLIFRDAANNLSVLYKEGTSLTLKRFDGINWNAVGPTIDTTSNAGFQIALTDAGDLVVAYLSAINGLWKPTVKKYDGTNWVTLGLPGFSYGEASNLNLLVSNDTPYVAYDDKALGKIVVAKYNGTYFGALGGPVISRDASSFPILAKSGNDIYVSYWSHGLFVKKSVSNIITPLYNCLPPSISVGNISDTSATLTWSSTTTVAGYEYSINTTNTPVAIINTTATSHQANSLLPHTTYYVFVRQICGIDTSAWDTVSFTTTNLSTGAELHGANSQLKVYPNPSTNIIHIEQVGTLRERTFVLYDLYGRVVVSQKSADRISTVSIKHLPAGMYTLKSVGPDDVSSFKIIKK